jgi:hypothetical protein
MIPQDLLLNFMERGPDCIDLGQDVHAVAVLFYHAEQPADLALDPPEPH